MANLSKIFFILFLLIIGLFFGVTGFAQSSDSASVNLNVTNPANSCNNGDCEVGLSGGVPVIFQIKNIIAGGITANSANISWSTNQFALCQFFWGKNSEYGKEIISETNYATGHLIYLKDLDFSSSYHFKITCTDSGNEKDQTSDQQFKTLTPLNNVADFAAVAGDKTIKLSWANPIDSNFSGVKILRAIGFYPLNVNGEAVVYEGSGNSFEDSSLANGTTYYYAIFATDKKGNYSSGALAYATPYEKKSTPMQPQLPTKPAVLGNQKITINDFKFSAGGANLAAKNNNTIEVPQSKSLNISSDCSKLSGDKTVLINLQNNEKTSSFILKQEGENNSCNVSIILPQNSGTYPLNILIINSKNEIINKISANLKILAKTESSAWFNGVLALRIYILMALAIIILMIWFMLNKQNRRNIGIRF